MPGARIAAATSLALFALGSAAAAAPPSPGAYGANDAGGFRDVLPPGTTGLDNTFQFAAYQATDVRPLHWDDQQPLYVDLLYASPTLTDAQVGDYFKDATFGVKDDEVESTISPRDDVTIVRDSAYGIPHVYGSTRGGVMFGAGYVAAQDRLFLMDILRHYARADLSSFAGGAASNRESDREQWTGAPYTEADLQEQIDRAEEFYGRAGLQLRHDGEEYVKGINAYIAEARSDQSKMPSEYALVGSALQDWKITDIIATASLIGGIYGRAGGQELRSALFLQGLKKRFGAARGRAVWSGFRAKFDPETTHTLSKAFPYQTGNTFSRRGLAMPDAGSVSFTPVGPPIERSAARPSRFAFALPARGASNALLVPANRSASGKPVAVMGPEVGYYVPQVLMEEDLHGPGVDAAGVTFPGASPFVLLGHGRDYAWSATSAYTDDVDTFADPLCEPDGSKPTLQSDHYRYRGKCRRFETLTHENLWKPNLADQTPPGSETLTAKRALNGILYARGLVKGKPVAYVRARATYHHETDSGLAFAALNDPAQTTGPRQFQRNVAKVNFAFNWYYVDSEHIAYYQSGWYPVRAPGTSSDFPLLGDGRYDWRGLDLGRHTQRELPFAAHPNAIDPPYIVNWNNPAAPRWPGADDQFGSGAPEHSTLLTDKVVADRRAGRKVTAARLVQIMEETATQDVRGLKLVPLLARGLGKPADPKLREAIALLKGWQKTGAHRRDLDKDGHYDDDDAVTLIDAWWAKLLPAEFGPGLGENLYEQLARLDDPGIWTGGAGTTPDFCCGWFSYVSKDLRAVFGPKPRGGLGRRFCGGGTRGGCRKLLRRTLNEALATTRQELYGGDGDCADAGRVEAACFDEERPTVTAGVDISPWPFMGRPTFQQVVEVKARVPH